MTSPIENLVQITTPQYDFGDILTHLSISSGNRLDQLVIFNLQIRRNTIKLRSYHPFHNRMFGCRPILIVDVIDEGLQLFQSIHLLDSTNHPRSIVMDHLPFRSKDVCIDQGFMSMDLPESMDHIIVMVTDKDRSILTIGILIQSNHNEGFQTIIDGIIFTIHDDGCIGLDIIDPFLFDVIQCNRTIEKLRIQQDDSLLNIDIIQKFIFHRNSSLFIFLHHNNDIQHFLPFISIANICILSI